MTQDLDPYAVLGVAPSASAATIRKAYHALARAAHPDLVGDGGLAMMQRLNSAWAILRDPRHRAAYDATRPGRLNGAASDATTSAGATPAAGQRSGSHRPNWTGAAGAPPGRPEGSRIDFGLFAGWTLGEIARRDSGYLAWLAEHKQGRPYAAEIKAILDRMRPAGPEQSKGRRWGAS